MDYDMCYTGGCNRAVNRSWEWRHTGECYKCGSRGGCHCRRPSQNCQGSRRCLKYYPGDYLYGETMTRRRDGYDFRYASDYQDEGKKDDGGKGRKVTVTIDLGDDGGKSNGNQKNDTQPKWDGSKFDWRY
jgi:hypothetical protein